MPQLFKIGGYIIYFWSNEGTPEEYFSDVNFYC